MLHVRPSQLIIAGDCAAFKEFFFSWCIAIENIRYDVDENIWPVSTRVTGCPPKNIFFHGCYFVFL